MSASLGPSHLLFSALSIQTKAPSPELTQEQMAGDTAKPCELDQEKYDAEDSVKIICLGDSAVGKSKCVGRLGEKDQAHSGSGPLGKPSRGRGAGLLWEPWG